MVGLVLLALVAVPVSWVLVDYGTRPHKSRHARPLRRLPRHSAASIYARGDEPRFTLALLRSVTESHLTVRQQLFIIRHSEACA